MEDAVLTSSHRSEAAVHGGGGLIHRACFVMSHHSVNNTRIKIITTEAAFAK